jgi:ATP-dependent helicase/DNAse subunit B
MKFWEHEKYWREKAESTFRPVYLELSFGTPINPVRQAEGLLDPESKPEPILISLPDGTRTIRLKGKINRVDMDEEGYFAIYDYKLGTIGSATEIKEGRHPQLPLYLWVLETGFGLTDEKAIGAAYFSAGDQEAKNNRNQGLWKKELASRVGIGGRVRSSVDQAEWQEIKRKIGFQIADSLQRIEQGDFTVQPTWSCPEYCSQRHVCRFDRQRIDPKKQTVHTEEEF